MENAPTLLDEATQENRASFTDRLTPLLAPGALADVMLAYMLAKYVHRAQKRKELGIDGLALRYFEHPRRVTLILIDEFAIIDPVVLVAGLLHDVVEDSAELSPFMIEHHWGAQVASLVQILSKVPKDGYLTRLSKHGDWRAIAIKAADRLDNLRSLRIGEVTPEFRARQIAETKEHYMPLFERLLELIPHEYAPGAHRVVAEIASIINS